MALFCVFALLGTKSCCIAFRRAVLCTTEGEAILREGSMGNIHEAALNEVRAEIEQLKNRSMH